MKKLLTILIMLLTIGSYSQVSTICLDSNNIETLSFYDEQAIIRLSINEKNVELYIDLDGNNVQCKASIFKYQLTGKPVILYNYETENYNILFDLKSINNSPIGGLLDTSTNTIMFYYSDGSSLLYIGEGILILL